MLRVLHRSAELAEPDQSTSQAEARTAELRGQAERSLRMPTVLATGGFPEEAPSLVAKAMGLAGAATLSALRELAPSSSMATPTQVQELVGRGALPAQMTTIAGTLWSETRAPGGGEREPPAR